MTVESAVELAQQALLLAGILSVPLLALAAFVGLLFAGLQTLTGLRDPSLLHVGRFIAVSLGLLVSGAWLGQSLVGFASRVFGAG